jgi:hypothetical protein
LIKKWWIFIQAMLTVVPRPGTTSAASEKFSPFRTKVGHEQTVRKPD